MRIVGNSIGTAPTVRKRSLSVLACSRVRVTRTRLPCNGDVAKRCSGMLALPHSRVAQPLYNRSRTLSQGLLCEATTKLFCLLDPRFGRPMHTLMDTDALLPIQADDQPCEREGLAKNLTIGGNGQVTASTEPTHKDALSTGGSLYLSVTKRSKQSVHFWLIAYFYG